MKIFFSNIVTEVKIVFIGDDQGINVTFQNGEVT